ncbi:MAG: hypothetical protein HYU36_20890 [Planctomycetes bacterium]|nr:hypothetical protein [Planctomycetota bacterium]
MGIPKRHDAFPEPPVGFKLQGIDIERRVVQFGVLDLDGRVFPRVEVVDDPISIERDFALKEERAIEEREAGRYEEYPTIRIVTETVPDSSRPTCLRIHGKILGPIFERLNMAKEKAATR